MKRYYFFLAFICIGQSICSSADCQDFKPDTSKSSQIQNFKPLKTYSGGIRVGDKIPDLNIDHIINYPAKSLKLSDFRGKKLIIDFWGTYCTACFEKFPLTDSIQKEFGDKLQVLLVANTGKTETLERIQSVFKRFTKPGEKGYPIPSAIYDTLLNNTFPHLGNPHYVWIDESGIVKAITGPEEMTREKIVKFITTGIAATFQKDDYNYFSPLYTVDFLPVKDLMQFSLLIRGFQDGLAIGTARRMIYGVRRGTCLMNHDLLSMYRKIGFGLIPEFSSEQLRVQVKDPGLLFYTGPENGRLDWIRKNFYTYDLVLPEGKFDEYWTKMIGDLNANTPYTATVETSTEVCWVLEKTGGDDLIAAKDDGLENTLGSGGMSRLKGYTLFDLCTYIRENLSKGIVVLDRTGFSKPVNLEFRTGPRDLETLQKYLKRYGMQIRVVEQPVQLLIVKDYPINKLNN